VLIAERVRDRLGPATRFTEIETLRSVDSTNRLVAARAAAGAEEGLVVAAEVQTAGRGRLDRSWQAEPGAALLVSVLLRPRALPPGRWYLFTAAAALAGREACQETGGFTPELKWPNDLMVGERKLAGILAEATGEALVVGMGLNVHGAPPGAAWTDEVAGRRIDRTLLLAAWLAALDRHLGATEEIMAAYRRACSTIGREVSVQQGAGQLLGWAEAVDDDGRLVVRRSDGTRVAVSSGDVIHVRSTSHPDG
jgi:BirA family biotin operon repressor/biotin-[acetyl-CoA-carboxylase] ligase